MDTYIIYDNEDLVIYNNQLMNLENRACVVMDFRGNSRDTTPLEKELKRLQSKNKNIILCRILSDSIWIEIKQEEDYRFFFQYFLKNNQIKKEYKKSQFWFYIYMDKREADQSVDEQRLFYYFLIANQYGVNRFNFKVIFPQTMRSRKEQIEWNHSNYYRTCCYSMIQFFEMNHKGIVRIQNGGEQVITKGDINKIGKILPVFSINSESLRILQKPIDKIIWKKIKDIGRLNGKTTYDTLEDALCILCGRYLFKEQKSGKALSRIRKLTFQSEQFYELIEGIPLIALLIFAEFDYFSRVEMFEIYKKKTGRDTLRVKDFLDDYQSKQTYQDYIIHTDMVSEGMNNKSLLTRCSMHQQGISIEKICMNMAKAEKSDISYEPYVEEVFRTYNLHTQVVTEVYEAVTIAEGILQLTDNVVKHANKGLMSMRIHCMDDKSIVAARYPSYFVNKKNHIEQKYYLEVNISDLSGTNIAQQFKVNNSAFGNRLSDEKKQIFDNFRLKSFFAPEAEESALWETFYQDSRNIVNHYGLQIFDSIIQSKGGFFVVASEEQCYPENETKLLLPGTSYSILLPLDNRISEDKNIYDSMLAYDIQSYLESSPLKTKQELIFSNKKKMNIGEKSQYYEEVCTKIKEKMDDNCIGIINMENEINLECVVKGMLLYIFQEKEKDEEKEIEIAFVNCKTYQIVEIVRLISLSYNKMGENNKMQGIQIYIKGKNIGEEIIFFGNTLAEAGNNIMKMACMRGVLYDNFHAVDMLLKRK